MTGLLPWSSRLKYESGVLTVEALLVLPGLILVLLWIIAIIQSTGQVLRLDEALNNVSREMSQAAYTVHQSAAILVGDWTEGLSVSEDLLNGWADRCLREQLADYDALAPALTWQQIKYPPIRLDQPARDSGVDDVVIIVDFQPSLVQTSLAVLLPEAWTISITKQQKAWLIGRDLLPFRGLEQSASIQTKGIMVYITRWGQCYHRAQCRYLAKSKIIRPLSDLGEHYQPCSVCHPPLRH